VITWIVVIALVLLAVVMALVGTWALQTAHRLNRLHVRYDLSWQALDAALARRAVVARAVAVDSYGGGPEGRRLAALADAAERAPRSAREAAENELSATLAMVEPAGTARRASVAPRRNRRAAKLFRDRRAGFRSRPAG
jgi:hypothetical protein